MNAIAGKDKNADSKKHVKLAEKQLTAANKTAAGIDQLNQNIAALGVETISLDDA